MENMLDQLTREQLVSLRYDILRRLLSPNPLQSATSSSDVQVPRPDGQFVFDPTIDAWEHTGIYPQGYAAVSTGNVPSSAGPAASVAPQFGRPGMEATVTSDTTQECVIIGGPPCTAFSRPWLPGCPSPQVVSGPPFVTGAPQSDDPWATPEILDTPVIARSRNPVLPLNTLLPPQNRTGCTQLCQCSRPCVVARVGHVTHFCRICIDQRPAGEPRSGA